MKLMVPSHALSFVDGGLRQLVMLLPRSPEPNDLVSSAVGVEGRPRDDIELNRPDTTLVVS